jgi:hypothetical protein
LNTSDTPPVYILFWFDKVFHIINCLYYTYTKRIRITPTDLNFIYFIVQKTVPEVSTSRELPQIFGLPETLPHNHVEWLRGNRAGNSGDAEVRVRPVQ